MRLEIVIVLLVVELVSGFSLNQGFHRLWSGNNKQRRNEAATKKEALHVHEFANYASKIDVVGAAETKQGKKMNIANQLTIVRVIMIPVFMGAFLAQKRTASIVVYALSCFTDLLDGWIARNYDMTSDFGAFLDPVADKLMIATVLLLLVCQMPVWWFAGPVVLVINREIAVSALRAWMAEKNKVADVQVSCVGKSKTAMQMISTTLLLLSCTSSMSFNVMQSIGANGATIFKIGVLAFYVSTVLAVVSGAQYFKAAWPVLAESAFE